MTMRSAIVDYAAALRAVFPRLAAARHAYSIAAIMLEGFATPFPAMSNAVP